MNFRAAGASKALRLSVLDQAPISEGMSGAEALQNSIDLAHLCDGLGYERYWVAEHHGTPMLACASPEALIGPIATATGSIRVGSGGVMLPHYSPLKVAETFSMFAGLFPGRIDLGLGRAPGSDAKTAFALQRDRRQPAPDDFPEQLVELLAYLEDRLPPDHPFRDLSRLPGLPHTPEPFLLGSSPQSGIWAAQLGLPYVFADFINPGGAPVAARYRLEFEPAGGREPRVIVAVWALAAESDEEAERLSASHRMAMRLFLRGTFIPVPPVEKAQRFLAEDRAPPALGRTRRRIVGSPATVRAGIEAVAAEYQADEVMVVTITHEHAARRRSYELIAEAFGLGADSATRTAASPSRYVG
jgi:luciferase family oxidoreductase group 1